VLICTSLYDGDFITLFIFIELLCGSDNILYNFPTSDRICRIFHGILSLPHKSVLNMNNVMLWSMYRMGLFLKIFISRRKTNEGWYGDWQMRDIDGLIGLC
jgi:hypothetical protein